MSKKNFFLLFLLIWFVPPLVKFFDLDSYSISTVTCVGLFSFIYLLDRKPIYINKHFVNVIVFTTVLISINIVITSLYFQFDNYDYIRSIISFIFFMIFLSSSFFFNKVLLTIHKQNFNLFFKRIFYFYIFIVAIYPITDNIFNTGGRPIFPYTEPSHFALFFGPVLCYNILSAEKSRKRLYLILIGLVIAVFIKNLTLLVTITIISIFVYRVYVIPLSLLAGLIMYFFADIEYFLSRLDFSDSKTNNLSVLVYKKGYELIEQALIKSKGLGIGFQQLGYVEIDTPTRQWIMKITHGQDLNEKDGGFLSSKIISEFGIVGILLIVAYLILLIIIWFRFGKENLGEMSPSKIICYSSIITLFSELFFRSLGYFTPSVFLFLVAIFLLMNEKKKLH